MVKLSFCVRLEARPDKAEAVRQFLEDALPLANDEPGTPYWFAVRLGPTSFGIFDAFPDEAARQAHLHGRIAEQLLAHAGELLSEPPRIEPADILAAKLPA